MRLLKHAVAIVASYAVLAPFLVNTASITDAPIDPAIWLLVALTTAANPLVLAYHHMAPPHPKFLLLPRQKWAMRAHIASGTIEFLAGLVGIILGGNVWVSAIMVVAALAVHVPTSFMQTPGVFGSRALMRPGYLLCIGVHGWCAVELAMNPDSLFWTVSTFLLLNTYVWVRGFHVIFGKLGVFRGWTYSLSVLAAGLLTGPIVLGPATMLALCLAVGTYVGLYVFFFIRTADEFLDFVRERGRDSIRPADVRDLWLVGRPDDPELARAFFDMTDVNRDGTIDSDEIERALESTSFSLGPLKSFMATYRPDGRLRFEDFLAHLWPLPQFREAAGDVVFARSQRSERDAAEFVFRRIDLDGDGLLGPHEIQSLMDEWALPPRVVRQWRARIGLRDDEGVDFDCFFRKMRVIWRFIFYDIITYRRRERGTSFRERILGAPPRSPQAVFEQEIRMSLVRPLPFLKGADDALVSDLASCIVEEHVPAETVVMREGERGDDMWIIRSGRVEISVAGRAVDASGAGEFIGEGALLDSRPRTATVTARQDSTLYRISRASFAWLIARSPEMARSLAEIDRQRLENRLAHGASA